MKVERSAVLVGKEFVCGSKNLVFLLAVALPVLLSLFISLVIVHEYDAAGALREDAASPSTRGASHVILAMGELTLIECIT